MSTESSQTFGNHARYVPLFHFVAGPLLLINFVDSVVQVVRTRAWEDIVSLMTAIALLILFFTARQFATTVQDRVIRLEEQLRYDRLLPTDLRSRSGEFTVRQIVAMRFAPDAELPTLARTVLERQISSQKEIKQMIKEWRGDHLRA